MRIRTIESHPILVCAGCKATIGSEPLRREIAEADSIRMAKLEELEDSYDVMREQEIRSCCIRRKWLWNLFDDLCTRDE